MRSLLTECAIVFIDGYPSKLWRGGYLGHYDKIFTNKLLFSHPKEATYEIWLKSVQRPFENADGRTTKATLSYKLTYEPLPLVS